MKISTMLTLYIITGLLLKPQLCIDAASSGLELCFEVVIPSLFPFFICSKILVKNGFAEKVSRPLRVVMRPVFNLPACGAFAFVTGILSGCPVGAKTVTDLYEKKLCSFFEAQRMLCFCNNSGPLFIIGSVATGMLGFKEIGMTLYISHILSAVAVGILLSFFRRKERVYSLCETKTEKTSDILGDSMRESVSLMGYVCGFVILFSVATEMLKCSGVLDAVSCRSKNGRLVAGMLLGMCEMTNGIHSISSFQITPALLCVISFILGFGGLSVILQVYGIVKKYNFSVALFSFAKLLQGILSCIITCGLLAYTKIPLPVFGENAGFSICNSWAYSIKVFSVFGILILFLSILYTVCKLLRRM